MSSYSKNILYVEDDQDDIAILNDAIEALDTEHHIVPATNGANALEVLQQMNKEGELPCLIVLDINMPGMDGKQTLMALQQERRYASIPIVLFSTSSSFLDKAFSELKKVELLTKPFDVKSLFIIASKLLSFCIA